MLLRLNFAVPFKNSVYLFPLFLLVLFLSLSSITYADSNTDTVLIHDFTTLDWLYTHGASEVEAEASKSEHISVPNNLFTQDQTWNWTTVSGWYELHFDAQNYWSRKDMALLIGILGELDETSLNGELIGKTGSFAESNQGYIGYLMGTRVYPIPKGLLKAHSNVLRIKHQSILGVAGVLQKPVGISQLSEAQNYKQQREHAIITWQSFLLGMTAFNLLIALILSLKKREQNMELMAFLSIYVIAVIIAVLEHLMVFENGLKTVGMQQTSFVLSMLTPIPILYYIRSVMNIRGGYFAPILFSLLGSLAVTGWVFFNSAIILSYCYFLWFLLTFIAVSYALILSVKTIREQKHYLIPLFIGVFIFWLSIVVLPYLLPDIIYFARHDEIGHLFFIIGLTLSNIQRMVMLKTSHKKLSRKVISIVEDERTHLARELHDGINQRLAAQRLHLQMHESKYPAKALKKLSGEMLETMHDMNRFVHHLRPLVLKKKGLVAAMQDYVNDLNQEHADIKINLYTDSHKHTEEQEQHLFRIFQESLNNAIKYAKATVIGVELKQISGQIILKIQDNGQGIKAAKSQSGKYNSLQAREKHGQGTINIRERVDLMDGDLTRTSSSKGPDKGTLVKVIIPMRQTD